MNKINYGIYAKALSDLNKPTPDIKVIVNQSFYTEDNKSYCGVMEWKEVVLLNGLFSNTKNFGSILVDKIQNHFNKTILINVTKSNEKLIGFYTRIGFSCISVENSTLILRRQVNYDNKL